jgi:hypothetical protein
VNGQRTPITAPHRLRGRALTDSPDRQASSGVYAFGDSLLFLAVFGLAAETAAFAYFVLALVHRS